MASCSDASHSLCVFCGADTRTKAIECALQNRALKDAWDDSCVFVVLSDDEEHSGQTGRGSMESASIRFSKRYSQNCSTRLSFRKIGHKAKRNGVADLETFVESVHFVSPFQSHVFSSCFNLHFPSSVVEPILSCSQYSCAP